MQQSIILQQLVKLQKLSMYPSHSENAEVCSIRNRNHFLRKTLRLWILFLFLTQGIYGQWIPKSLLTSPTLSANDSNRLSFSVDLTGFFKNNEYFSPVADGQTLPGVSILPALGYQISDKFRAELGAYGVKYSGRTPLSEVQAFIRLQYAITPKFNMIVGNLYGGMNHRLIEPLYQWERQYTANPESGLQFVFNSDHLFADVWVDWQNFIERGDSVPERLTFGLSTSGSYTTPNQKFKISIPLQVLIHHQGGQIDVSDEPMIVLGNLATGICSQLQLNNRWVQSVGLDVYYAGYYDRYPQETVRPYDKGWGIYPVMHVNARPFEIMAGYWHGNDFYAFEGEPLFGSFNVYNLETYPIRNLCTFKFAFSKELFSGVFIGAQLETYSDIDLHQTDYSFGVSLRFNKRFLFKPM